MDDLITRAREYIKDKFLDVADVSKFIEAYVKLYDEREELLSTIDYLERTVERLEDDLDEESYRNGR